MKQKTFEELQELFLEKAHRRLLEECDEKGFLSRKNTLFAISFVRIDRRCADKIVMILEDLGMIKKVNSVKFKVVHKKIPK